MPEVLEAHLFPDDGKHCYAIVDGASCEELVDKLAEFAPPAICLFAGDLAPDVRQVAPHLVELAADHAFTGWLLENSVGKHWGIYVRSSADLRAMRKHFRTFLLVRDPTGKQAYFRYYDPRVLALYLPTCNAAELRLVFGPVTCYLSENGVKTATIWENEEGVLAFRSITLQA